MPNTGEKRNDEIQFTALRLSEDELKRYTA